MIPMTGPAREFPRFALEATVELTARGFVARGRTSNVSRGGLAATVDRAIAPGEVVTGRMALVFDKSSGGVQYSGAALKKLDSLRELSK